MITDAIIIREIEAKDNASIESVIRACFPEFKLPLEGTAYADSETPKMYESYQANNEVYYVVDYKGEILGGAGIKPLQDFESHVCELQKMYFSPKVRGLGIGKSMFQKCLDKAKQLGYKQCYLESASQLKVAIHIYEQFQFKHLEGPLGNTGHFSCGVWMIKDL
ncbi:GNAT family N-acetyltransferase [Ichthyenterobacterium sp. W332]|uniref:GNAT family N-acetyltransferase n=1 Tax=Microcosmobacter mediterraneus TaxID=3075607 RepID=A0ABU2YH81_9FLAO|nr:GNAT family N-acetyltransferase [Ichthyenterobacterium sp. W332]MDT0557526.1 GNAT family N-acetyltransferase [Ichthyenterobacterium sp. W332]